MLSSLNSGKWAQNVKKNMKLDFKEISSNPMVKNLSEQWVTYEKRVKTLIRDFDLKSRDARVKGKEHLDKFLVQLKKTRTQLESNIRVFAKNESKVLNKGFNDLVVYLKTLSQKEAAAAKKASTKRKTKTTKRASKTQEASA